MAGYPADKIAINDRAGLLAVSVRNQFREIQNFGAFLAGKGNAELEALGFSAAEVTVLKDAFKDLRQLGRIYAGTEALPTAYDFNTFTRSLMGVQ